MGNRQQINKCNNNLNNQNYGVKIKQGKEDGEQGRMRIEDGQYPCHNEWFSQHKTNAIILAIEIHPRESNHLKLIRLNQ